MNITTSSRLVPPIKTQIDRSMNIRSNQRIIFPTAIELESFTKEVKSVLIETSEDVFVISFDNGEHTVGSTTLIPLHKLSTTYVVVSTDPFIGKSQFAMAAIQDNTTISIKLKMKRNTYFNVNGRFYSNGQVLNVTLGRFETYQIDHRTDFTGTVIESSLPIAAFSGNDCNMIKSKDGCDHLIEQLPPTTSLDVIFIIPPFLDNRDSVIRVTAIENCNVSHKNNGTVQIVALNEHESHDFNILSTQTCVVESPKPIIVTSFGSHSKSSMLGDPSMLIVPGINQYLDYYKTVVPFGFERNYISVMMKQSAKDSLLINNTIIHTGDVVYEQILMIGNTTYSVRSMAVAEGEITVSSVGRERFGLIFSGVAVHEAYSFSGNSLLL